MCKNLQRMTKKRPFSERRLFSDLDQMVIAVFSLFVQPFASRDSEA